MRRKKGYFKNKSFSNSNNQNSYSFEKRILFVYFCFIAVFFILASRLYALQIRDYAQFSNQAEDIHEATAILTPQRGLIYCQDKNGEYIPLAMNKKYYSLYTVPKEIENPEEVSEILSELTQLPYEEIFEKVSKLDDPYELILKKIDDDDFINQIEEQNLQGVYFNEEYHRYYPFESFAAQTIGFVAEGDDGSIKGRYGLEAYYDKILEGQSGVFQGIKDALGRLVRSTFSQEKKQIEGISIETTLDKNVQFAAQKALEDLMDVREASKGTIIVMEVKTGKILALANWPTFNINNFAEITDYSIFRNYAVEERYEPGSVMKPFTMLAGLDTGKVTPDTTYIDKGYYQAGDYLITNYKDQVHGEATMRNVLEFSINTGAIFVAKQVGVENLRKYFKQLGFGEITGIDLPHEITGDLSNLEYPKVNDAYFVSSSYGLGISVTPISLIRAYAILANKGKMVIPYLVESTRDSSGNRTSLMPLKQSENPVQVVNEETVETLTSMLVGVIENGYGGNAKIKGYSLAGKTGTSFVSLKEELGYSEEETHTFAGFFPASDPEYVVLVKMDKPHAGGEAASQTVTLAFREVERFLVNYYNIPPDEL
jgi:cell division protein FtsI/penicillin-binding protein 2